MGRNKMLQVALLLEIATSTTLIFVAYDRFFYH